MEGGPRDSPDRQTCNNVLKLRWGKKKNREKYPKDKEAPKLKTFQKDEIRVNNESYINDYFKNNPGKIEKFIYPTDFKQAKQ